MKLFTKIFKYELRNILRSKWMFFYSLFYFLSTQAFFQFNGDNSKIVVSLLNLSLILIPVVSIIFGTIYIYNSREFIEMILTQPVERNSIFYGIYLGMSLPLALSYIIGVGIALLMNAVSNLAVFATLLLSGGLLTFIFMGISILIAFRFNDKAAGIGVSFIIWMFFALIYDALIMLLIWQFTDYPLEKPLIAISMLNPIDMARIMVMLKFDAAALMGYTGATFEKFFGSGLGIIISSFSMIIWILIPLFMGQKTFAKKDF